MVDIRALLPFLVSPLLRLESMYTTIDKGFWQSNLELGHLISWCLNLSLSA
jgi:hypothetical protein